MGELMSEWFGRIREHLPAWTINSRCQEIPLVRARYGEDSGIAGAAALCLSGKNAKPRTIPRRKRKRK
jgi:predicted NBD/HSP70 family sugar kinase